MAITFSYLVNPASKNNFSIAGLFFELTKKRRSPMAKPLDSFKIKEVSVGGAQEIKGYLITGRPFTPTSPQPYERDILDTIAAAAKIAKSLGADILGLDGFSSLVADKHQAILKSFGIPITSGNAFNAWSIFEALYHLSIFRNIDFKNASFALIGATTATGSLCARKLSEYVSRIALVSEQTEKLKNLQDAIRALHGKEPTLCADPLGVIQDADLVIFTGYSGQRIPIERFKSHALICDATVFKDILGTPHTRSDITIVHAGIVKVPFKNSSLTMSGAPACTIDASLAETILLALENKALSYSLGENVNIDRLEEIANIATRHAFEVWLPE